MPYIQVPAGQLISNQTYFIKENVHGASYNIGTAPRGTFVQLTGTGAGEPVAEFLVSGEEKQYSIAGHTFHRQAANVGPPNAGAAAESANNPTEGSNSRAGAGSSAGSGRNAGPAQVGPGRGAPGGGARRRALTRKQRQLRKQKKDRKTRQHKQSKKYRHN